MSDSTRIGGRPTTTKPATTEATSKTEKNEQAAKTDDAVGIGDIVKDAALSVVKDAIDPLGMVSRSKAVIDGVGDVITGKSSAVDQLKGIKDLANLHATIDTMKPGSELEIGRKLELELEGESGETEVGVALQKNDDGSFDVTFDQHASVGAELASDDQVELGASAGYGASVTFHAKNAEEAKRIVDEGLYVMSMGPGADAIAMIGTAVVEHANVTGSSVAVEGSVAAEIGFPLPTKEELGELGLQVEGEVSGSYGVVHEAGPPAKTFVEVTVAGEGGAGLEAERALGGKATVGGAAGAEGTLTLRYEIAAGPDDAEKLKTPAGQREILERAKSSSTVSAEVEGEFSTGKHVVTGTRSGEGASTVEALRAASEATTEVEVQRVTSHHRVGGGIKTGENGGSIELAWAVHEPAREDEKKKVLGG